MRDTAVSVPDSTASDTRERLSVSTKLAFGAGDLGPAMATGIISFFQLFFLITVAVIPANVAGGILLIVRIWDAFSDPIVGWLSDRTVSKHGRRRPWLLYGALPFGLSFFLMWLVPPVGDTGKMVYYLVLMLIFSTFFTIVNVPYTALTPELTRDYDERTSLNAYRFAFSIGGSLFAVSLHEGIVDYFCINPANCFGVDRQPGYIIAGAFWGFIIALPFFWCFFGTRERDTPAPSNDGMGLLNQVRVALSNRPFLFVIGIYLCSWLAVQITASIIIFYVTFWLQNTDFIPLVLLAVQGSAFFFLFVWNAVSQRIGKKAVYITGMSFWIAVQLALFFVQPGQEILALILAVLAGVGIATAYLIPWSMMPDVIELDELETGQRREGIFYGFMVLLQKLGLGLGLFLVGQVLAFQGFIEGGSIGQQPESALLAIRLMLGPVPAVVLICGIVLAIFYPITKQKHAEMLAQIQIRRSRQAE